MVPWQGQSDIHWWPSHVPLVLVLVLVLHAHGQLKHTVPWFPSGSRRIHGDRHCTFIGNCGWVKESKVGARWFWYFNLKLSVMWGTMTTERSANSWWFRWRRVESGGYRQLGMGDGRWRSTARIGYGWFYCTCTAE